MDAEVVAWDEEAGAIAPFGMVRAFAAHGGLTGHTGDTKGYHLFVLVFDLLFHNGDDLTRLPLSERRARLARLSVPTIPNRVEVVASEQFRLPQGRQTTS